jgi:hypothetical protein
MGRSGKAGQWVKAFPRKWETADALGQRRVCIAAMTASLYARSMSLGGGGPSASQAPRRNHRQRIIPAPFALRSGHDHPQGLASRLTTSSRPGLTAGNSAEPLLLPTRDGNVIGISKAELSMMATGTTTTTKLIIAGERVVAGLPGTMIFARTDVYETFRQCLSCAVPGFSRARRTRRSRVPSHSVQ